MQGAKIFFWLSWKIVKRIITFVTAKYLNQWITELLTYFKNTLRSGAPNNLAPQSLNILPTHLTELLFLFMLVGFFDGACEPTNPNGSMGLGAILYDAPKCKISTAKVELGEEHSILFR